MITSFTPSLPAPPRRWQLFFFLSVHPVAGPRQAALRPFLPLIVSFFYLPSFFFCQCGAEVISSFPVGEPGEDPNSERTPHDDLAFLFSLFLG